MLTQPQRDEIVGSFAQYVGLMREMKPTIRIIFDGVIAELGDFPANLYTVPDQAEWVVNACYDSQWGLNPSLMERLLAHLVNQGGFGGLQTILDQVRMKIDPRPNPFQAHWVMSDQPFLNRRNLRDMARKLVDTYLYPILRVNGPARSGKSYTTELLYHAMNSRPHLSVVPVKLAPGSGPSYCVEELAESLVLPMNRPLPLPARTTSSYPRALCRWVIRNANDQNGIWVFVLDGFGQMNSSGKLDLQDEVIEFIQVFAQQIAVPTVARKLRLVLLHFETNIFNDLRPRTSDDGPLPVGAIMRQDVVDCLREFNSQAMAMGQPSRMIDPASLASLADLMLARCGPDPSQQLPALYEQLYTLATR